MRLIEFASAEEQMALWKLLSDNMWQAISQQAEQENLEKAKKATASKPKPAKLGGGRKSAAKSAKSDKYTNKSKSTAFGASIDDSYNAPTHAIPDMPIIQIKI